jgi:protein TonB
MDSGSIVQYEGDPTRRRFMFVLGLLAILAAFAALYYEPYMLPGRIHAALHRGDTAVVEQLIEPNLHGVDLSQYLDLACARRGTWLTRRYDGFDRFIVIARPAWSDQPSWAGREPIEMLLHRRGLSWVLADIQSPDLDAASGRAPQHLYTVPTPDPDLPRFGEYVYVEDLPEALTRVAPQYPNIAREAGVEGTVLVQALIDRAGRVHETRVQKSIPMLDQAAVDAVRQWTFKPARAKGVAVAVWVAIPVRFRLS